MSDDHDCDHDSGIDENEMPDVLAQIESLLGNLDPSAMVTGFVLVSEWIEDDGRRTVLKLGTDMTPWHEQGLLAYVSDMPGWVAEGHD